MASEESVAIANYILNLEVIPLLHNYSDNLANYQQKLNGDLERNFYRN